jgi:MoxR-like ATPase
MSLSKSTALFQTIAQNLSQVLKGQDQTIRKLLAAFASGGHVLLEDLPGTGKTTLAKALAQSLNLEFQRVQFTPDLLPSDILGVSIFDSHTQTFRFHQGPVFTEILLADEINRASPRTQSALLEAMAEQQVTIEGKCHHLGENFFVIATQNPIEFHGTYPLPEAQMDRFAMRLSLGYVTPEQEVDILNHHVYQITHSLSNCASAEEIDELKQAVNVVRISPELQRYIVDLVQATRHTAGVQMGASPRASVALMLAAKALALFDGLDFVSPEHIQELAVSVIAHRLKLDSQARFSGSQPEKIVEDILRGLAVPI